MNTYPKQILSIEQQIQSFKDAGMIIISDDIVASALTSIGYYRLRGYCYPQYSNHTKQYLPGTDFESILKIYQFDTELSALLFSFLSKIEVSLRVRLTESLLIYNDTLILSDPTHFSDKKIFWENYSYICSEIARSKDVFIRHNFTKYDGQIPLWAAVEVLSFGTLSRLIKNMETGKKSAYSRLATHYKYRTAKGKTAAPSQKMFTSWIQALVVLRNTCAHNSRIYNRSFNTMPEILSRDKITPTQPYCGLYQLILAMKYLSPGRHEWNLFYDTLTQLLQKYDKYIKLSAINFPSDWEKHLV